MRCQKRSKDLLDVEMADLRLELDSLKPYSEDEAVIHKEIIGALLLVVIHNIHLLIFR